MFVVPRELDLTQAGFENVVGYEWFKWLRDDLSMNDGRALVRRQRNATDAEKELAATVTYVALQGNPSILEKLLEDTNMSDEVRKIIQPIVREEYSKELDAIEKERDEAVQEKNTATQEMNKAKQEMSKAKQIISDMIAAGSNKSIDPSTLAKAEAFLAATN